MNSKGTLSPTKKTIRCTNVPTKLLEKNEAKRYFKQFGSITRIVIKPKSCVCIIEYGSPDSAEYAITQAGDYDGETFLVGWDGRKKRMPKKVADDDPDWTLDPDVKAELEAMGTEFAGRRKYNLRPEKMEIEAEQQQQALQKKARGSKRSWKTETTSTTKVDSKSSVDSKMLSDTYQELMGVLSQPATTTEEKLKLLTAKDQLIRFLQDKKPKDISETKRTVGTCPDMCPEKERLLRIVQHQVALYEQDVGEKTMNHSLAVKQYSRSAAHQETALPHDLRNVDVLQMTMGYLMHRIMDICDKPDANLSEWYHFLWDRTRGIRKDITQQELCSQGSVELVEQCARFHIHCSARLVAEDASVFDEKINTENLTKCLQTLKYMYHDLGVKGERCENEAEFRAYVILLNLNDGNFMWEVQKLRPEIQKSHEVKFALRVHSAIDKNNYVEFFNLVRSTTYLNACILLRYFNQVRLRAVRTILKSYSPRAPHTLFPVAELNRILAFEGPESTIDFLVYHGLMINEERNHVLLDKNMFSYPDLPYALSRAVNVVESKRTKSVGEVVCGRKLPAPMFEKHVPFNSFDKNGYMDLSLFSEDIRTPVAVLKEAAQPVKVKERSSSPLFSAVDEAKSRNVGDIFGTRTEAKDTTSIFGNAGSTSQFTFTKVDKPSLPIIPQPPPQEKPPLFPPLPTFAPKTPEIPKPKPTTFPLRSTFDQPDSAPKGGFSFQLSTDTVEKEHEEKRLQNLELKRQLEEQQREVVRKKEEELRKLAELKRRRELEAEERRRKQHEEELRRALLKKREEEEEKERARRLKEAEDEREIAVLLAEMVTSVENLCLEELRKMYLQRKTFAKWRSRTKALVKRRKRKAVDQSPLWVSAKSARQTAEDFYTRTQDVALDNMKRYKSGKPVDVDLGTPGVRPRVDLLGLTGKILLKSQEGTPHDVYWKVDVFLDDALTAFDSIETVLNAHVGWKEGCLLEQEALDGNKITYCVQNVGWNCDGNETDGFIFVANCIDGRLLAKIRSVPQKIGRNVDVPIVLILEEKTDDCSRIEQLLHDKYISDFKVISGHFGQRDLCRSFDEALIFLAEHSRPGPPLELNTLHSLLDQYLGTELWQRIGSFAKWNCAYKQCLTKPDVVVDLYNEGLARLRAVVFSNECYEHSDFPALFRDFLPSKIPTCLPCDYKYFPSFWRETKYKCIVDKAMDEQLLPKFRGNWPPKDQVELERNILGYCRLVFEDADKVFYRIMAMILRNFEHGELGDILWSNIAQIVVQEKLSRTDFGLNDARYSDNTVYNQLFVIYDKSVLREFATNAWFYVNNAAVRKVYNASPEEEVEEVSQDDDDFDLDKTFNEVMYGEPSDEYVKQKDDLKEIRAMMEDLEEAMAIQRKITKRFSLLLEDV